MCLYMQNHGNKAWQQQWWAGGEGGVHGEAFGWVRDFYFNPNLPNDAFIYNKGAEIRWYAILLK